MHVHKSSTSRLLCMLARMASERWGIGTEPAMLLHGDCTDSEDSEDCKCCCCCCCCAHGPKASGAEDGTKMCTGLDDEDCTDSEDGTCCCCCASGAEDCTEDCAEDCTDIGDCTDSDDCGACRSHGRGHASRTCPNW